MSKTDVSVWFSTFMLTVFADLTIAVEVGMVLAALLFIHRVANTTTVELVTDDELEAGRAHLLQDRDIPSYVAIYRIHGPLLFGTTDKVDRIHAEIPTLPPVVLLRLRDMTALDATGLLAFEELAGKLHASGRTLILCGAREQPARLMRQAEFHQHVGDGNICVDVEAALRRAREIHEEKIEAALAEQQVAAG
jgi:SulP family sulfate permease